MTRKPQVAAIWWAARVVADVRRAAHGRRDLRVVVGARGAEHGFDDRGPIGKSIYVAFLAADEGRWVTGQRIGAVGGMF